MTERIHIEDLDNAHPYMRVGWGVGSALLEQAGYEPDKVYDFLLALEGHPEITGWIVENIAPTVFMPGVKAQYLGNLPWGEKDGETNLPSNEFYETAASIFRSLEDHTGHSITDANAHIKHVRYPANITAKVKVGSRSLTMIVTKG